MTFFCIADEDTVRGFRLAGIPGSAVATPEEALTALEEALRRPEWGILILTQKTAAAIRERVESIRFERDHPLVVEIPGPEGPLEGRKSLRRLMQEAVGVSLG